MDIRFVQRGWAGFIPVGIAGDSPLVQRSTRWRAQKIQMRIASRRRNAEKGASVKSKDGSSKCTQQKAKAHAEAGVDVVLGNRVKSGIQALVKGTLRGR